MKFRQILSHCPPKYLSRVQNPFANDLIALCPFAAADKEVENEPVVSN